MPQQNSFFDAPLLTFEPGDSVVLVLMRTRLGMQRKIDLRKLPDLSDELRSELVSATAKILACPELKAISGIDSELSAWIRRYSVPSLFKWGAHLFRTTQAETVNAKLTEIQSRRDPLVRSFVGAYSEITEKARTQLGPVLSEAINWPPAALVPGLFSFEWRWLQIGFPEKLRNAAPAVAAREIQKLSDDSQRQYDLIQTTLRRELYTLLNTAVERLTVPPAGKPPVFRDSLITNITDYLERLPERLLVEDRFLELKAERVRLDLLNVSPEDIRDNPSLRAALAQEFGVLREELWESLPTTRTITFEEDDESQDAQPEPALADA
jgi:hypothetical protein